MIDIRFMVVGVYNNKYAVKDIEDGIVEYLDYRDVISMSKVVKIYGVEGDSINLDWFKDYYCKCLMVNGEKDTVEKFRLIYRDDGFHYYVGDFSSTDISFLEFVSDFTMYKGDNNFSIFSSYLAEYISHKMLKSSRFFGVCKVNYAGVFFTSDFYSPKIYNDIDSRSFSFIGSNSGLIIDKQVYSNCFIYLKSETVFFVAPHNDVVFMLFRDSSAVYIGRDFLCKSLVLENPNILINIESGKSLRDVCMFLRVLRVSENPTYIKSFHYRFVTRKLETHLSYMGDKRICAPLDLPDSDVIYTINGSNYNSFYIIDVNNLVNGRINCLSRLLDFISTDNTLNFEEYHGVSYDLFRKYVVLI